MKKHSSCLILLLLALIIVTVINLQAQQKASNTEKPSQSHNDQTELNSLNQKNFPVLNERDIPQKTEQTTAKKDKSGEPEKPSAICVFFSFFEIHWYEIFLTVFTFCVAFFTYLLYRATSGLWDVAKRQSEDLKHSIGIAEQTAEAAKIQAQTMRDEFALKQRSKIHVRDIAIPYFEDPFGKGEFLEGQLGIVNLGGMPANIVSIGVWFEIGYEKGFPTEWPDESEKPNIPNPQPTKLEVGQSATYKFADERKLLSSYESIRIGKADCTLYVIGYVKYTDTTKLPRYSRFFREYRLPKDQFGGHKEERRFFPMEGYEYEE